MRAGNKAGPMKRRILRPWKPARPVPVSSSAAVDAPPPVEIIIIRRSTRDAEPNSHQGRRGAETARFQAGSDHCRHQIRGEIQMTIANQEAAPDADCELANALVADLEKSQ